MVDTVIDSATQSRTLVTAGDPDEAYPAPYLGRGQDFRDAPELARIGDALIRSCEEFADLKWAIEEDGFQP